MTYEEARTFIDQTAQYGSKPGLETISELLKRIGNPQEQLKIIHVAGTNGKGSTTAFLASILAMQGYRVGRYNSPSVFSYREKIQITRKDDEKLIQEYITENGVSETIALIKTACEEMVKEEFRHPTAFEVETAMAFLYLYHEKVDFAVIEVGMGGRLDATNVIRKPLCSVITSISMDHMQYLGDTLGKIAGEKAGIIKEGVPAVTGNTDPEILKVLSEICIQKGSELAITSRDKVTDLLFSPEGTSFTFEKQNYSINLLGEYQTANAILAIKTAEILRKEGYFISEAAVKNGLINTRWNGRFEVLSGNPYFIIDGAHNEDAALQLKTTIHLYFKGRKLIFIMGVLADKDYRRILQIMAPLAGMIITITPPNSRALASERLAHEAANYFSGTVINAATVTRAVNCAFEHAKQEDVIVAFGSLSFLGEIKEFWNQNRMDQKF